MFDQDCFNEAVKNAFIHNQWLRKVAPMVTYFEDRIEITSFSSLAPNQTMEGFYKGHSIPVNEELSSIFLATHLSERTGKGNPLIVSRFGRGAFEITDCSVKVTIPYNWMWKIEGSVDKSVDKLADILSETEFKNSKSDHRTSKDGPTRNCRARRRREDHGTKRHRQI